MTSFGQGRKFRLNMPGDQDYRLGFAHSYVFLRATNSVPVTADAARTFPQKHHIHVSLSG